MLKRQLVEYLLGYILLVLLILGFCSLFPEENLVVTPVEESIMSRFEITGIFIGQCEPINLLNPSCTFRMRVETSTSDKLEPGEDYIILSRDKNMEEVRDGEKVWLHCIRHDAERYRCDFRDFLY